MGDRIHFQKVFVATSQQKKSQRTSRASSFGMLAKNRGGKIQDNPSSLPTATSQQELLLSKSPCLPTVLGLLTIIAYEKCSRAQLSRLHQNHQSPFSRETKGSERTENRKGFVLRWGASILPKRRTEACPKQWGRPWGRTRGGPEM